MARKKSAYDGIDVEVDGIPVRVSIDPSDDYELAECFAATFDPGASAIERSLAVVRRNRLVLGDAYERVLGELRKREGGKLPRAVVERFVASVIEQVGDLKKSDPSATSSDGDPTS